MKSFYKAINSVFSKYGVGRFFSEHGIGRTYPIKVIHEFAKKKLRKDFAVVQGNKMFLEEDALNLSVNGVYEKFLTEVVKKEIKEGDVVLDIGSHIGYFTLIFAKLVSKTGKVFAFEPAPSSFLLLKKNIEINGYKNVVLVNKAVSNRNGKLRLFLNEKNKSDNRIYNSNNGWKSIEIESIKLDDYFKDYKRKIDLIKIDVQGAEWRVVDGMRDLLRRNKNIKLISEFWSSGLEKGGIKPFDYLDMLFKNGFVISEINEKKGKVVPLNLPKLLNESHHTNIICKK